MEEIDIQEWFRQHVGKRMIIEYGVNAEIDGELMGVENEQWLKIAIEETRDVWYVDLMSIHAFMIVED